VEEHDDFSAVPVADALEPNVEGGLAEMESHRDVIDDSMPVLEAEHSLEAPIAEVEELTPLSDTPALFAEPILAASDSPDILAVDGKQEASILVKDASKGNIGFDIFSNLSLIFAFKSCQHLSI
jgi:hypothetical protein